MNQEEKKKYIDLAKLSKAKNVKEGWVYVGFGKLEGLGFGNTLMKINSGHEYNSHKGTTHDKEYAAPVHIWENIVGEKYNKMTALPNKFYVATPTPELNAAIFAKFKELGFHEGYSPASVYTKSHWLGVGEKQMKFGEENDFIDRGYQKLALDDLFAFNIEKKLVIPRGLVPGHEVQVDKNGVKIGCQNVKFADWRELAAQISNHINALAKKFDKSLFIDTPHPLVSEAAQKYAFSLGYKWSGYIPKEIVQHTDSKNLIFDTENNKMYYNSDGFNDRYLKISLDEFFALGSRTLTIPAGLVPRYEVKVDEKNIYCAGEVISIENWKLLDAKVNDFRDENMF